LDGTTTVTATTLKYILSANLEAEVAMYSSASLVLPVALTVTGSMLNAQVNSTLIFEPSPITNGGGVTGKALTMHQESSVSTANGLISDIPGTAPVAGDCDSTCAIATFSTAFSTYFTLPFAGIPTAANLSAGTWMVVKDTVGGGLYVLANDGGVIKKVQLV
jgi:hypothetical protein